MRVQDFQLDFVGLICFDPVLTNDIEEIRLGKPQNTMEFLPIWLFRFLGYISFSLYLLHPLILGSFSSWAYLSLAAPIGFNKSLPLVFILTTIVCMSASWIMTKFIDDPGVKLSKYVYDRWFKKAQNAIYPSENRIK